MFDEACDQYKLYVLRCLEVVAWKGITYRRVLVNSTFLGRDIFC